MVLKRPFLGNTGGRFDSFVQVSGRQSFEQFSSETELQVDTIVLVTRWFWKGHSSVALWKTHLIWSGLGETELWAVLLEDALSCYSSFSGKMVLKRPFLNDTGEDLAHLLSSQGDKTLSCCPGGQRFKSVQ